MRMKPRLRLSVLLLAVLLLGVFVNVKIASSADTVLYVDPRMVYATVGESFTINIEVSDVERLHEWQVNMTFNPDVITFINVTEGDFLKQAGHETVGYTSLDLVDDGSVLFAWAIIGKYFMTGSGTLATVEFEVIASGESALDLDTESYSWNDENENGEIDEGELTYLTHLVKMNPAPVPPGGQEMEDIPFTPLDGVLYNLEEPPVALFTYSPELPLLDEVITFNASSSYAVSPREIVEYHWDFDDGTTAMGMVVQHAYTTGETFNITLMVIDDAEATALIEATFNTTGMPEIWYELYSSTVETIEIKLGHDVAVTNVIADKQDVTPGDTVSINVTVQNKGTETEDFNVVAYYDGNQIDTKPVTDLGSGAEANLIFEWDTTDIPAGDYQLKAEAIDVTGDERPDNNTFIDGTVTVKGAEESFPTTMIVAAVAIVGILIVVVYLLMRRRGTSPT